MRPMHGCAARTAVANTPVQSASDSHSIPFVVDVVDDVDDAVVAVVAVVIKAVDEAVVVALASCEAVVVGAADGGVDVDIETATRVVDFGVVDVFESAVVVFDNSTSVVEGNAEVARTVVSGAPEVESVKNGVDVVGCAVVGVVDGDIVASVVVASASGVVVVVMAAASVVVTSAGSVTAPVPTGNKNKEGVHCLATVSWNR